MHHTPDVRGWWKGYLVVGAAVAAVVVVLPTGPLRALLYLLVAGGSGAAILAGSRHHRPARRLPWVLLAAGQLSSAAGEAVYFWLELVRDVEPYPSAADAFFVGAFPLLCAGILTLTGRRPVDATGRVEVGIVVAALALPVWIFLGEPVVLDAGRSWGLRAIDLAYPVFDLVLLGLLVRLGAVAGAFNGATRLLGLGALTVPVADVAFILLGDGDGLAGSASTACWLASYLLYGAAALHPSMVRAADPEDVAAPASWRRLGVLGAAMLAVPVALALQTAGVTGVHLWETTLTATVVVVLGVARVRGAVVAAERAARDSERLRAEADHHAAHDPLTLLPNRATALRLLRQAQARAARTRRAVGLLVLDVDHLSRVNDTFGDGAGDGALRALAQELVRAVGPGDRVGRLGGDEFVVVVEDVPDEAGLAELAERLTRLTVALPGAELTLTCGVGVAVQRPGREVGPTELLHEAVTATGRAKASGEGRTWFFDDALRAELDEQADLEAALAVAVTAGQFELHYQPVLDLDSGRITSFEALIRWHRPGHGTVRPDLFIPVAERSDLICRIGRWVLAEATGRLARWRAEGTVTGDVRVAVNLSGRHLVQPGVVDDVAAALEAAGLPAGALVVEVTETVVLDTARVLPNLRELKALGVGLSLDDYGTGYTSIEQFRSLPLDTLKIDRSFLASTRPQDEALVGLVVHAAHAFGLRVVAEGVERTDQVALLRALGCDGAQGYLFSRPVPAGEVAGLIGAVSA
ncbi:putative bifunctional diguanylate cyclase/phosphodiesterase [Kineococcus sp. SYSU DK001]|uniref:putative bifunctional diguanylate cyclase/phosphodiesterase n=1 Tax=Kineococcus sp. SYSU DK001 TaxID=3383122 RepID=UPI003D7DA434